MDNFYRAKNKENGEWIYGIYLPLLDGACMILDDARICRKAETVDGEEINGHLIETVPIKRSTLGMCLGLEDNAGIPVFSGDYIKVKTASVIKSVPCRTEFCWQKKRIEDFCCLTAKLFR